MVRDLVNITSEEIKESAKHSIEDNNIKIMYLQNNGSDKHRWNKSDILRWIEEDIDD